MKENKIPTLIQMTKQIKAEVPDPVEQGIRVFNFIDWKANREKTPISGRFELTPFCNLDCKMCYINLNHRQSTEGGLMPPEKWIRLADEARENGMISISLTGGECLTYSGFDEVYLHLFKSGFAISILSNGLLMDPHRIEFLQRYPPKQIRITLYGGSEDEYELVTGHRVYEIVCRNIRAIREAGLPISITITPNPFSKDDQHSILESADELGVPYAINAALILPRENTGRRGTFDIRNDPFIEICRAHYERRKVSLKPLDISYLPAPGLDTGEIKKGLLCRAGRSSFTIQYDGKMCPCSGLDEITTRPIEVGFRNAWEELKEKTDAWLRPAECDTCVYQRSCLVCPAIHKGAPEGHCDRRICERTIQMIREGMWKPPDELETCIQ